MPAGAGRGAGAIDDAAGIAAYRVVQEALTNVTRHARARSVAVSLARTRENENEALEIRIRDDGRGMAAAAQRGFGLLGMRERVEALGGSLRLESALGRGVMVAALVPLGSGKVR